MSNENNLPSIQDLELAPAEAFKQDQFKLILNAPIPQKWIKKHPFAKQNNKAIDYLPIDKVEFLLDRIFQQWKVEVVNASQMFNAVSVQVRLHFKDPITGEWNFHDGVGAVGIQTDKGASASDLSAVKQDAVMKALPAAKSYAIKDAAEHLGDLFGRNLNRPETIAFKGSRTNVNYDLETLKSMYEEKREKLHPEDDMNIQRIIEFKEKESYKKAIDLLIKK